MNFFVSVSILTFFVVTGAGCTVITDKDIRKFYDRSTVAELVSYPKLNQIVSAEIGESLIRKENQIKTPALELRNSPKFRIQIVDREMTLSPGLYVLTQEDGNGLLYTSSQPARDFTGKIDSRIQNSIYIPFTNPEKMEACVGGVGGKFCGIVVGAEIAKAYKEVSFENSFKRELVYLGKSKNVISIFYKEFKNDIIRPAFTQEIKYDLDEGRVVGYKGARFEIIRADNQQIQYRVLKELD